MEKFLNVQEAIACCLYGKRVDNIASDSIKE